MTFARDDNDVLSFDEYRQTTMVSSTSIATWLSDRSMARLPATARHRAADDRRQALIDSIILTLLEDFARLNDDPDVAAWRMHGDGGSPLREKLTTVSGDPATNGTPLAGPLPNGHCRSPV